MEYDKKFKKRVIEYYEEGNIKRKTAETFGVSRVALDEWLKQYQTHVK
ncbi:MAG: helix-turn-helix domain containing protein [Defluviitaleaceae bacterium]|nr:helix-turn-helix domain containing protein [Defluviitaleaceae bacterium]